MGLLELYDSSDECISTGRSLWRSQDGNKAKGGPTPFFPVASHAEAEKWNKEKHGIFWSVNEIEGERKVENVKRILSWAIDFDEGTKKEQQEKIKKFGLIPSLVIESARGYHVYYDAIDATKENYNTILTRMCEILGADQGAKGLNRILRCPFYLHWKDESNPFAVRIEDENAIKYTEKEMLKFLKKKDESKLQTAFAKNLKQFRAQNAGDDFFEKVARINCELALQRMSGSSAVNGERFRFRRQSNGKVSVYVNEKSANVWIDASGKIGSFDKGGPTIYQWLKWYGHDHKKIVEYLKEFFPEAF